MKYRRFGRTELEIPVISCGGMRYQQSWKDIDPSEVTKECQENLEACIHQALDHGINHIETARHYGSSEMQLGWLLPKLERDKLIVQTKVPPYESADEFRDVLETSFKNLQLDYIDLFSFHGINNDSFLKYVFDGGNLDVVREYQRQGRIKHVGFSTHALPSTILEAIKSNEFDYLNLHWYYMDQINKPCIDEAAKRDMGVFIISPSDKGGKLYDPPDKLVQLCKPLSPIVFNALFCLANEDVHTLSMGVAKPNEFDEILKAVKVIDQASEKIETVLASLEAVRQQTLGSDWLESWTKGIVNFDEMPGEMNVYHILRLLNHYECFDMLDYGKMRYNLIGNADHWFPGQKVQSDKLKEFENLLSGINPMASLIPQKLTKAHEVFNEGELKRLSQSD